MSKEWEHEIALRVAASAAAEEAYFLHRPFADFGRARVAFRTGFSKGWRAAEDELNRLRAENEALRKSFACPGIPRAGCHYLAHCNSVCDKCGRIHSGLALANHLAAQEQGE